MAHFLTPITVLVVTGLAWSLARPLLRRRGLTIALRVDRSAPGAHLIWDIVNASSKPITIMRLTMFDRNGSDSAVPAGFPKVLDPQECVVIPTDVDWALLSARRLAAIDETGRAHEAPTRELAGIQNALRQMIDRRVYYISARDWLFGATDLAFGVAILGLGFFMLMWVIATG